MSTLKWNGINFRFKNIKRTRIYKVTWKGFHDNVLGQSSLHARKQVILFLFVFFSFLCQILLICLMKAAHWSIFSAIHLTMGPNISMKEKSLFLSKEKVRSLSCLFNRHLNSKIINNLAKALLSEWQERCQASRFQQINANGTRLLLLITL